MASFNFIHFATATGRESTIRGIGSPVLAHRPRKSLLCCGGSNDLTFECSKDSVVRCGGGGRVWRVKPVKAAREKGESSVGDDENDDTLQVTIEKSKKVLAMQRDLLQQIAERRHLVSSMKSTKINPEEEGLSSKEGKNSFPNLDSNLIDEEDSSNVLLTSNVDPTENQSPKGPSASITKQQGDDTVKVQSESLPPITTSIKDFQQVIKDDTSKRLPFNELPPFVSNVMAAFSKKHEKHEEANESTLEEANYLASVPTSDSVKPPPLAGANVMNVILVASECNPWIKTGGLGDVAGALPKALARRGHRVMVVVPRYGNYAEPQDTGIRRRYKVDGQDMEVNYFQAYIDGVDFVFIESPVFRNIENNIYGGHHLDILKRMVLFCKAAVEARLHGDPMFLGMYLVGESAMVMEIWFSSQMIGILRCSQFT